MLQNNGKELANAVCVLAFFCVVAINSNLSTYQEQIYNLLIKNNPLVEKITRGLLKLSVKSCYSSSSDCSHFEFFLSFPHFLAAFISSSLAFCSSVKIELKASSNLSFAAFISAFCESNNAFT